MVVGFRDGGWVWSGVGWEGVVGPEYINFEDRKASHTTIRTRLGTPEGSQNAREPTGILAAGAICFAVRKWL